MMLTDVVWLRRAVEKNDSDDVALCAFRLGIKWNQRRMKEGWEKFALAGRVSALGASTGGKQRGASDKIADRQRPLIQSYKSKRDEGWAHEPAVRYAAQHAYRGTEQKPYSLKHAGRILNTFR